MSSSIDSKGNRYSAENRAASAAKRLSHRIKCRVCYDAGKGVDMYSSHRVRETINRRIVVCPTLMATVCRNCNRAGHTVSRCPNKSVISASIVAQPPLEKKHVKAVDTTSDSKNESMFAMLEDSSDSDGEDAPISDMKAAVKVTASRTTTSWYDSDDSDDE